MARWLAIVLIVSASSAFAQDQHPPELVSFSFSPQEADISDGDFLLEVEVGCTDDVSGVETVIVKFDSPVQSIHVLATLDSGTSTNGVFRGQVTVSQLAAPGVYALTSIVLWDYEWQDATYSGNDVAGLGFPTEFFVTGSLDDNLPPVLTSFGFSPQELDISGGDTSFEVELGCTDDFSGVSWVLVEFYCHEQSLIIAEPLLLDSGTSTNGVWRVQFPVHQATPPGVYMLNFIEMRDNAGRRVLYGGDEVADLQFPTLLLVSDQPVAAHSMTWGAAKALYR